MQKSVVLMLILVGLGSAGVLLAAEAPREKAPMPEVTLPTPGDPQQQAYLGIRDRERFLLTDIQAEAIIVEVFSMYCPHCQKEAPALNRLYELIQANPKLMKKIKLIGLGAGNSEFEVDYFRKTYHIPFPLFADADFSIHKLLGEVRTPYFIVIKKSPNGSHQVVYSRLGAFDSPEAFLQLVRQLTGL